MCARHISKERMGLQRITCGSGNHTTEEYQEGIRNDRRHAEQKSFLFLVCVVCINIVLVVPQWTLAQDTNQCLPHCWRKVSQDISFTDGVHLETVVEEQDCKDTCFNNETCTGVYWGYSPILMRTGCWLQMPYSGESVSLTNANYWNLTACSDDCLPYCWKPKWLMVQTLGGIYQDGVNTEGQCKLLCSKDQACNGLDWNGTEPSCWLLLQANLTTKTVLDPIHHWEIIRNLPIICEQVPLFGAAAAPATGGIVAGAPGETAPSSGNVAIGNIPQGAGASVGESSLGNGSAPGGGARGGPSFGESNIGPAPAGGPPAGAIPVPLVCPNYLTGIIAMAVLMGVCGLLIIGLVAYIIWIRLEQNKTDNLFSFGNDKYRGYQSIGTVPDNAESSETETAYKAD